jgi:predicted transcriptional regulator YheO
MYVHLSETDRLTLNSYCSFADCLGNYLGSAYEVIVQSFGEGDPFVIHNVNCELHRATDNMIPDTVYNAAEQIQNHHKRGEPAFAELFGIRPGGKRFRFSSIGIVGGEGKLIGMLSINFWIDAPFSEVVRGFAFPGFLDTASLPVQISDSGRYNTAIKQEIERVKDAVMLDPEVPAKFKRKEIVRLLNDAGVFKMKNAIQICADTLDITIATIYMHIRNQDTV